MEGKVADSINNLETMLQTLRSYLRSELSVSEPSKDSVVDIKVKVQNTAVPIAGFAAVVFVGVGIIIGFTGNEDLLKKLQKIERRYPIQTLEERDKKVVIWYVNTWVEEDEEGYSTPRVRKTEGDKLFPGESKEYEIKVPFDYLPYISVKVTGVISPGNLFQSAHVLNSFEKWSKPIAMDFYKTLTTIDIHRPLNLVTVNTPDFGPKTTFEETTNFRKIISQAVDYINSSRKEIIQLASKYKNIEMTTYLARVILPYLESVEKACKDLSAVTTSGNIEEIRNLVNRFNILSNDSKEVDRKAMELLSRLGIEASEVGIK
jgi:hypothetical protein